jgi:hypothetical protein
VKIDEEKKQEGQKSNKETSGIFYNIEKNEYFIQ